MKKRTNTNEQVVEELRRLFPRIGSAAPNRLTLPMVNRLFQDISVDRQKKALTMTRTTMSAVSEVGLQITVNDIGRVVQEALQSTEMNYRNMPNPRAFPAIYKGVSFNPQTYSETRKKGEWIILLDFFSIMRSLINRLPEAPKFFILDAGLYWVINLLGNSLAPSGATPRQAAEQILQSIATALRSDRFNEVIITNKIRNSYLRAIAERFPANNTPPVVGLKDVWFDPEFLPFLVKSIETFCIRKRSRWQVLNPVSYNRYMAYSPWVTPLAAAETIFIGEKLKVRGILSPTAEAVWNKVNDQFSRVMQATPFTAWMYERRLGKILAYQNIPFFSDSEGVIAEKLVSAQRLDPTAPRLFINLISPFVGKDETSKANILLDSGDWKKLASLIYAFLSLIEKRAGQIFESLGDIPPTPLDQAGWLADFPPGIC